uniref:Uncharacterized protein n=1 Tax=Anguilla anguilla TaxID=7936 RepID=A0A0E9SNQ4_ANGAN
MINFLYYVLVPKVPYVAMWIPCVCP